MILPNTQNTDITFNLISSQRIGVIAHKDVLFKYSVINDEIVMFDFIYGPNITKNVPISMLGLSGRVSQINKIENSELTELIIELT